MNQMTRLDRLLIAREMARCLEQHKDATQQERDRATRRIRDYSDEIAWLERTTKRAR